MTRDIKLRMWTGSKFVYRNWNDRNWYNAPSPDGKHVCEAVPEDSARPVTQFTGLHDKNGVEIYCGDIVKSINGLVGIIIFENGSFVIDYNDAGLINTTLYSLNHYDWSITKAIGNIDENPELLEA